MVMDGQLCMNRFVVYNRVFWIWLYFLYIARIR